MEWNSKRAQNEYPLGESSGYVETTVSNSQNGWLNTTKISRNTRPLPIEGLQNRYMNLFSNYLGLPTNGNNDWQWLCAPPGSVCVLGLVSDKPTFLSDLQDHFCPWACDLAQKHVLDTVQPVLVEVSFLLWFRAGRTMKKGKHSKYSRSAKIPHEEKKYFVANPNNNKYI